MSEFTGARVSVITATRDRPALLRRALQTVASQTCADSQMIVADDGSDPKHLEEYQSVQRTHGERLTFFHAREAGAPRSGPGPARNRAMLRATTEYIAFLDDDDQWVDPDHLATAVAALDETGAEFFFANMQGVRGSAVVINTYVANRGSLVRGVSHGPRRDVFQVPLPTMARLLRHDLIHPNVMVIRRSLRERVGLFHDKIRWAEDTDWALRLVDAAKGVLYRDAVVAHIRLPEQGSSSLWESDFDHLLDEVTAAQYTRAHSRTPEIIRSARAREAWSLRELSRMLSERGARRNAMSFALQGALLYPTPGALAACLKALWHSGSGREAIDGAGRTRKEVQPVAGPLAG